jgi:quinol monooxygenase YgiN
MSTQQPIHVFAKWKVKEGHIEIVLQLLKAVRSASVQETGNLFYKVHQSNTDVNTLILFEGYRDEAAVAEHRNSAHYQDIVAGKIVPLLDEREVNLTTPVED